MSKIKATKVFRLNWNAMHKTCETCNGSGFVDNISCSWCGDPDNSPNDQGSGFHWRYIINKGSSRSSKTISLIDCHDLYARENDFKRITIWRDTKTDCRKTVLVDMLKHLKKTGRYKLGHVFNKTESIFTYDTESTVEIHGTDDEEAVHGLTQDIAHLNEPYKISRDTFDQIDMRTSLFVFIDYNPKKGHWVDDIAKDKRAIVLHSTFKDNPFCPPEQRKKILSYQPIQYCEIVRSKLLEEADARVYDAVNNPSNYDQKLINELLRCKENEDKNSADLFKWQVYGLGMKGERPNRIFHWTEIPDQDYYDLKVTEYIGVDWGKVDPWGIVKAKYYDGCLYLHELNYASENEIRSKMTSTEKAQIAGDDDGIVTWLFSKLGIDQNIEIICDTNRPLKIAILRRFGWNAIPAAKARGSILDGIDLLDNLKVFYTRSSMNIAYEQENYSRKIDSAGQVLEEPEDADNHSIDPARYIALHLLNQGIIKTT